MLTSDAGEQAVTELRVRASKPTLVRLLVLAVLYTAVAGFAVSEFIRYPGLASARPAFGGEAFFGDMVYGRAPLPYVTRVLVPWLVRAVQAAIPPTIKAGLEQNLRRSLAPEGKPEWLYRHPLEFVVTKNLLLLFAVGFALALWWLARLTLDAPSPAIDAIPVFTLLALPGLYGYASHLYDFPALCLFTLGLALIAARCRWLYPAVFLLVAVNKETALLLTLVWAISESRRLSPRQIVRGVAWQMALWGLIRGALLLTFRDNPGDAIGIHLFRNLQVLAVPRNWFLFRPIGDWLVLPVGFNLLYVLGLGLSCVALRRASRFLKDAFWVAIPFIVLTWLFGNVDEMRVYYELLPVIALVLFSGLYSLMGYKTTSPSPHHAQDSSLL